MSDTLRRICFSNAPFRGVKRVFFHRWVLGPVGAALAVGLPLILVGVAGDLIGVVVAGYLLTLPFQCWVGLLAVVSFVVAVPRFLVLGVTLAAVYFGLPGLAKRLGEWAAKCQDSPNPALQPTAAARTGSGEDMASGDGTGG